MVAVMTHVPLKGSQQRFTQHYVTKGRPPAKQSIMLPNQHASGWSRENDCMPTTLTRQHRVKNMIVIFTFDC